MPKMIDSGGNPGTGGNDMGDVTEAELEVPSVVVGVLMAFVTEVVTITVGSAMVVDELEVTMFRLLVVLVV
jgi:hypothetical protein